MMNNLFLFQMNDSNFPIGSFSHSFGFETYLQRNSIYDQATFDHWLDQCMRYQILRTDGFAVQLAYQALEKEDICALVQLTEELNAQILPCEIRRGNQKMGSQFLTIGQKIMVVPLLEGYEKKLKEKQIAPHPALVYTILAFVNGASKELTISAYLLNMVATLVQNAVRGVPIGQVAGQKLIWSYQEKIDDWTKEIIKMKDSQFGACAPGIEISQMQHEFLFARNFMS
ncbi:urease accessory protein UreF [Enterococcus casseliflavus]|uniref:urease accessory protein UreF n=1 Tax=Enterococcus casseliflavus TaxID=37734 RepID=UPI003DA668E7